MGADGIRRQRLLVLILALEVLLLTEDLPIDAHERFGSCVERLEFVIVYGPVPRLALNVPVRIGLKRAALVGRLQPKVAGHETVGHATIKLGATAHDLRGVALNGRLIAALGSSIDM